MELLAKDKSNTIDVLISKYLVDSNVILEEFLSLNNLFKEYGNIKD